MTAEFKVWDAVWWDVWKWSCHGVVVGTTEQRTTERDKDDNVTDQKFAYSYRTREWDSLDAGNIVRKHGILETSMVRDDEANFVSNIGSDWREKLDIPDGIEIRFKEAVADEEA